MTGKQLAELMMGKSQITLHGGQDWRVKGKYMGHYQFAGVIWIVVETGSGTFSYNPNKIFAIEVG